VDEYEIIIEYIPIKIYIKIKDNVILIIMDIKAYMLVIIKPLVQVLELK